jgi:hypothetical protein
MTTLLTGGTRAATRPAAIVAAGACAYALARCAALLNTPQTPLSAACTLGAIVTLAASFMPVLVAAFAGRPARLQRRHAALAALGFGLSMLALLPGVHA